METGNTENKRAEYPQLTKLFKKWDILSANLKYGNFDAPLILPDLCLQVDNGCDVTQILESITEFLLPRKNLLSFYGDVKFFQFMLNYTPEEAGFTELTRLMREVRQAAGFRNRFKGIVHIDVNEWLHHVQDKRLVELMNYLAENSHDWMIVLTVRSSNKRKQQIEELAQLVARFLRTEELKLGLPKSEYYLSLLKEGLLNYGITLKPDAEALMSETIKELRSNKSFGGEHTVNMLALDIVYTIYSRQGSKSSELEAAELSEFAPESEYVTRAVRKMEMKKRIGFVD